MHAELGVVGGLSLNAWLSLPQTRPLLWCRKLLMLFQLCLALCTLMMRVVDMDFYVNVCLLSWLLYRI